MTNIKSMKWRPIETAPNDGTLILLSGGKDSWGSKLRRAYIGKRGRTKTINGYDEFWLIEDYDSRYGCRTVHPTHWMPLPEPPEEGE